jgi:hypothetical protein
MTNVHSFRTRGKLARTRIKRLWLGFLLLVPFLLLWVHQSVRSTQVSYQILKIEEEIRAERNRQIELEIARDRIVSLEAIENAARTKLGLVVPRKENIVLITLPGQSR